jgi:hypothetical protein
MWHQCSQDAQEAQVTGKPHMGKSADFAKKNWHAPLEPRTCHRIYHEFAYPGSI